MFELVQKSHIDWWILQYDINLCPIALAENDWHQLESLLAIAVKAARAHPGDSNKELHDTLSYHRDYMGIDDVTGQTHTCLQISDVILSRHSHLRISSLYRIVLWKLYSYCVKVKYILIFEQNLCMTQTKYFGYSE